MAILQQLFRRGSLFWKQKPYGPSVLQVPVYCRKVVALIIATHLTSMHEIRLYVPVRAMKGLWPCVILTELIGPGSPKIKRCSEGYNGIRVQRKCSNLFFQQPAGFLIQPIPQRLIHLFGPHFPLERRSVVGIRQGIQGGLHIVDVVSQPQRTG